MASVFLLPYRSWECLLTKLKCPYSRYRQMPVENDSIKRERFTQLEDERFALPSDRRPMSVTRSKEEREIAYL
uniref:Uncharacterized protein n=1 Tax=Picea glauca TaxID=3330 RepID=A0A101LZW3_PICGL|nr:hypothetical protein ABT39_MTgene4469 [Picea glauca]QHR91325.1 hypothetical protein Q903MT_gene5357 [Picea sitchensis]